MVFSIVTGASRGIGRAIAEELAFRGRDLILVSLPGEELSVVAEEIRKKYGREVLFFETDLARQNAATEFFEWFSAKNLRADILINNAGFGTLEPFEDSNHQVNQALIMLNVFTPVILTRLFIPVLKKEPQAWIMNLGSTAGLIPVAYKAGYSASKSFIYTFSRSLGVELESSGIGVTVICPGGVYTSEVVRERIRSAGLMPRLASLEPEEVAKQGLDAMFKRKALYIPGFITRMVMNISFLLPFSFYGRWMARHFSRDFNKSEK